MAMLTLRISDELNDRLTKMAEKTGRTKTWFVKKLIRQGLDDLEEEMLLEIMYKEFVAEGGRGIGPGIPLEMLETYLERHRLENSVSSASDERTTQTRSTNSETY
jgi:RHH-type transcriptional regulator, rel operon repressor / antitoxin RelB